jgi:pimeloyl-ACP methyl ester carboxylesterase
LVSSGFHAARDGTGVFRIWEGPILPAYSGVVFIHGYFSANHVGPNRLYATWAQSLAANGVSTVRFDWPGMGNSLGRSDEICLEDIVSVTARHMEEQVRRCERSPWIVAHSIGCLVALRIARLSDKVRGMVLLAPGPRTRQGMMRLLESDHQFRTRNVRNGIAISPTLIREVESDSWFLDIPHTPTHIVVCDDDPFVEPIMPEIRNFADVVQIRHGGHNFTSLEAVATTSTIITSLIVGGR